MGKLISATEFEAKVLEKEEIVIKIRAPANTQVQDFTYDRKAAGTTSITDWLDGRIKPLLNKNEVVIIAGDYASPHGRTKIDTVRKGYEK
jgi:hypothetical protein